tara:strand:- start:2153 stop:2431 length:279 start_codon:yes stop_codon:yes gene_type:complete
MATIYFSGGKIKHADETKSFVIISKTAKGEEFVWGETADAKRVEQIKNGEHWAFPEGKFVRVEEFENRWASWASKHRERLEILYGRFYSRPR